MTTTPSSRPLSVLLAGGGTAGHIEPALAVADALREQDPATTIRMLGTPRGLETQLIPQRGYPLDLIHAVPLPRKLTLDLARLPSRLTRTIGQVRKILLTHHVDVVVGFGGYVSLPAYLAAASLKRHHIKIIVHEANSHPGLANKIGARFADCVLAGPSDCLLPHAEVVGIPLRSAISNLDRPRLRPQARQHFGLPEHGPVVFVFGGSQGARSINRTLWKAAPHFTQNNIAILHSYGPHNSPPEDYPPNPLYRGFPYIDRMDLAYAAADLAICRAGAMTVAELSAVGLPAIYIPLPIGNGEQYQNGAEIVRIGGALMITNHDLTTGYFLNTVVPLIQDSDRLESMRQALCAYSHPHAATTIATIIAQQAHQR